MCLMQQCESCEAPFSASFPFRVGGFTEMGKQTQLTQKVCKLDTCSRRHLIHYCKAISRPEALNLRTMLENHCLVRHNSAEFSTCSFRCDEGTIKEIDFIIKAC